MQQSQMTKQWWCLVIVITAVALFCRAWFLPQESVVADELFSRRVALSDPTTALNLIIQDLMHPPLYYFALKATMWATGDDVAGLRFLSLVCGVGSIVLVVFWGYTLPNIRWPAALAAILIALNNVHLFYSQQARPSIFFCLFASVLLLWSLLLEQQGHKLAYWIGGTLLMTLILYADYFGAFFIVATIGPLLLYNTPRKQKFFAIFALVVTATAFLPWLLVEIPVYLSKGLEENVGWVTPPTYYDLKALWASYLGIPNFRGGTTAAFLLGIGLVAFGLIDDWRSPQIVPNRRALWTLTLSAFLTPLLTFIAAKKPFDAQIFGARHVVPCILPYLFLVSYGLSKFAAKTSAPKLIFGLGGAGLAMLQILALTPFWNGPQRPPFSSIAEELKHSPQAILIYTTASYDLGQPLNFYLDTEKPTTERVRELPKNLIELPHEFILVYRLGVVEEQATARALLNDFNIVSSKRYAQPGSEFGTELLQLSRK